MEKKQPSRSLTTAKEKSVEEEEDEHAKDGVSLDELFKMKPEIFQNRPEGDEAESDEEERQEEGKKKSVELEFDEETRRGCWSQEPQTRRCQLA